MQENEFEKSIREKMEGLQLAPSEEVWKKVSANIQEEKKRRRFFFFLLFAILLAGSGGLYLYYSSTKTASELANNKSPQTKDRASDNVNGNTPHGTTKSNVPGDKIKSDVTSDKMKSDIASSGTVKKTIGKSNSSIAVAKQKDRGETNNEKPLTESHFQSQRKLSNPNYKKAVKVENQPASMLAAANTSTQTERGLTVSNDKIGNGELMAEKNNTRVEMNLNLQHVAKPPAKDSGTESKKDTVKPASEIKAAKMKVVTNRKWSYGLTVSGGISGNHSRFPLFPYVAAASASPPNQSTTGAGNSNTPAGPLAYKSSFSYGAGIYLKTALGKRVAFTAGLNYHYISAISLVGSRNSSSQTFYDANLQNTSTVTQFYNSGRSVEYTNGYHLLELPLNFLWQLNKSQNKPLFFLAGLAPSYLLNSNALYGSSTQNVYYSTSEQFNKWQLALQTGLEFNVFSTRHILVAAGPHLQYGLNNMAKQATGTNQHLVSASLKLNVGLK